MGEGSSHSLTPKTLRISLRKLKLRMPHHGTQRCSNETSYGTLSSCSQQLPLRIDYIRQARLAVRWCQGTVGKRWYGGMRERMGFRPKRIGPTFWSGLIRSSRFYLGITEPTCIIERAWLLSVTWASTLSPVFKAASSFVVLSTCSRNSLPVMSCTV